MNIQEVSVRLLATTRKGERKNCKIHVKVWKYKQSVVCVFVFRLQTKNTFPNTKRTKFHDVNFCSIVERQRVIAVEYVCACVFLYAEQLRSVDTE